MTCWSARSILANFCPKKKWSSNGSKPIGVLIRTKLLSSDLRLPISYLLPDFKPHCSNFLSPPTAAAAAAAITRRKGVDTYKNRAHKTFGPVRIIWNGQATCYLVYSQFRSTFDRILQRRKNRSKNWTSNHCMPIGVLTHKNSLVSKDSYRKVIHRT